VGSEFSSAILLRIFDQHLDIGQTPHNSLLLDWKCLQSLSPNVVALDLTQALVDLFLFFRFTSRNTCALLFDNLETRAYKLIFEDWDVLLHSKVEVGVQLQ
jgi:hypothetical protein